MVWFRRLCMAVGVTAALTVFAAPAWAQSQVTYALAGVETAATSTQGTFFGVASAPDDFGIWQALILHDELDSTDPRLRPGGGFAIDGQARDLRGIITGGTIARLGGTCRKEAFAVTGDVLVVDGLDVIGSGEFTVKLTHYGFRMPGGGCVTFFATVDGDISFILP